MFDASISDQPANVIEGTAPAYIGDATYSPDDNKLRLYPFERLDADTYARVKAHGFKWAPRQRKFVAPMWKPGRADLLTELCGDIGDEDTSLTERAEERAERFEQYKDKRTADANAAQKAVAQIADGIPMGQPILVGHHSERRARKAKERIDSGMRKAVKMWETANYWEQRAAGAIAHAKYKELPAVRHRRIKTIEADKRAWQRSKATSTKFLALWQADGLTHDRAVAISNSDECHVSRCFPLADFPRDPPASQYEGTMGLWSALTGGVITFEQARDIACRAHTYSAARADRWLAHFELRLGYERAMLNEQLGIEGSESNGMGARFDFKAGGRILTGRRGGEWVVILRVNTTAGAINSLTTTAPASYTWAKKINVPIEGVVDYKPPSEADSAAVVKANKLPPMVNYPGEGFVTMTAAEWKRKPTDCRVTRTQGATANHGKYRYRSAWIPGGSYKTAQVYITDEKTKERPAPDGEPVKFAREVEDPRKGSTAPAVARGEDSPSDEAFKAMKEQLKKGGAVVAVAPQLFPTPAELARKMADYAGVKLIGGRVLEPSAGTGNLVRAAWNYATGADCCKVVAIESDTRLAEGLREMGRRTLYANDSRFTVHCADFLECTPAQWGRFNVILMNPPFESGADIKHIRHALTFLAPGGKLAAICANGPRQRDQLMDLATHWEDLPAGSFKESGTNVNTALLVIDGREA
ncbi:DUF3560 domain-containing protein [Reyranella sp.]|uniref:DUF3560 domain-containing protein n=1 Tax=Reyranella sp. TaxID=1929291 RepID=UPI00272F9A92|nr:DUF3560 domain-containing protein [Reyranella sp.]MDP2374395.1 DUF3560 domain-containing protein [Reyranella sp.]